MGTARTSSISSGFRRRMKMGLPRHLTVIVSPYSTELRSKSAVARAAADAEIDNDATNLTTNNRAAEAYAKRTVVNIRYANARRSGSLTLSIRSS